MAGTIGDRLGGGWYSSHTVTLASDFFQSLTQERPVSPDQPQPGVHMPPALHSTCPRNPPPSGSQREYQALQDLMDLAREGLSSSQLPSSGALADLGGTTGETQDGTRGLTPPSGPSPPCDQDHEGSSDLRFPGVFAPGVFPFIFFPSKVNVTQVSITISLNRNQG